MGNVVSVSKQHLGDYLSKDIKQKFSSVGHISVVVISKAGIGLQKGWNIMAHLMEVRDPEYPTLDDISTYGTVIHERYRVLDVLGEGTFGRVIKVVNRRTGRKYALKVIKETDEQDVAEAHLEIDLLRSIRKVDPHGKVSRIIALRKSFVLGRNVCMMFSLMEISLFDYMRETKRSFSFYEIKIVGYQLLQALKFMKKLGVVHGDLKPENVMFKNSVTLEIKVIDLGSAFAIGDQPYQYFQTRYYRAPESILGGNYNNAVDMWSVGCILFEMRTSFPLFVGGNEAEQLQRMVEVFGMPPLRVIEQARYVNVFFTRHTRYFRLRNARELYYRPGSNSLFRILNKRERWKYFVWRTCDGDFRAFVQLLRKMLAYLICKRISAENAMNHRFFKDVKKYMESGKI